MGVKRASHCVYDTRYHLVCALKYRKWVLQGAIRQRVKELLQEIAGHHGFEIEEMEVDKDHVHLFLSFSPQYSIGQVVEVDEGRQCEGDSGRVSGGSKATVGRRVLGRWVLCVDRGG